MPTRKNARSPSPRQNHLLDALQPDEYARLLPDMEPAAMLLGAVVHEANARLAHVYFPTTSIISLLYVMEDGDSSEIAIAGNEGLVGFALIMGGQTTSSRAVVQCAGKAYRIRPEALQQEFDRGASAQQLILRYTQALITQMVQTAACNRHHTIEQQFCRWLLLSIDRLPTNELPMTEGLIANMLGVHTDGVTSVAAKLQRGGMIRYDSGRITVLNRKKLQIRVCECYEVVKKEFDRLLIGKNLH